MCVCVCVCVPVSLSACSPVNRLNNTKQTSRRSGLKTFLNFQRHLIEMKLLAVKVLEEINKRDLYELDSYQRKAEEVGYVESCAAAVDSSPHLTSVPQGAETLPYLNREAKS